MNSSTRSSSGRATPSRFAPSRIGSTAALYVSGSGTLVRAMLADGLVDELHLFMFPLAPGSGQRLFPDGNAAVKLELAGAEPYDSGAVHLAYRAVR